MRTSWATVPAPEADEKGGKSLGRVPGSSAMQPSRFPGIDESIDALLRGAGEGALGEGLQLQTGRDAQMSAPITLPLSRHSGRDSDVCRCLSLKTCAASARDSKPHALAPSNK
jgi:hypothetical protein